MPSEVTDLVEALINACIAKDPDVKQATSHLTDAAADLNAARDKDRATAFAQMDAENELKHAKEAVDQAQQAYDKATGAAKTAAKAALDDCKKAAKAADKAYETAVAAHWAALMDIPDCEDQVVKAEAALKKALEAARKRCREKVLAEIGRPIPENERVPYYWWGKRASVGYNENPKKCGICTVTSCMMVWDIDSGPASTESQARKAWQAANQLKLLNDLLPDLWKKLWEGFSCENAKEGASTCRRKVACGYKQQPSYLEVGALSKSVENPDPDIHEFKWMLYLYIERKIKCVPGTPEEAVFEPFEPYTVLPEHMGHRAIDDADTKRVTGD